MIEVTCKVCGTIYHTSKNFPSHINPEDCPNCTRDSLRSIQKDVNFLYRTFDYKAVLTVLDRLDRLWKKQYLYPTIRDLNETIF